MNLIQSGIVTSQLANEISYAHVSEGGLIGGDDACIHAGKIDTHAARLIDQI